MIVAPKIENAPGHTWNKRKYGWECRWQARTDIAGRGYEPRSCRIWNGTEDELTESAVKFIQTRCRALQDDMLAWSGGTPSAGTFDGSLYSLAACYRTDKDSPFVRTKLRYVTRQHYDNLMRRLEDGHAADMIADIKARHILRWHEEWSADGKVSMGHAILGMLRTLLSFGATILEDAECARLSAVLSKMRFAMSKPRVESLTVEQVNAIRAMAHKQGRPSMALAQAFQFECILRQKDVIGEWVPVSEPGLSDTMDGNKKWLRGLRWDEIDQDLVLHHVTSKRNKLVEPALRNLPMVMEEFALLSSVPLSGPIVISEETGRPYSAPQYRREWRKLATLCGIPKSVRNMDSRSGAITEALQAGAPMDSVRKSATHSDQHQTAQYSRGDAKASAEVAQFRAAHRNKSGT